MAHNGQLPQEVTMKVNPVIGQCTSPNGKLLPVYKDSAGRQYILDANGWRAYGQWLPVEHPATQHGTDIGDDEEVQY
jgi:hypothetical protein